MLPKPITALILLALLVCLAVTHWIYVEQITERMYWTSLGPSNHTILTAIPTPNNVQHVFLHSEEESSKQQQQQGHHDSESTNNPTSCNVTFNTDFHDDINRVMEYPIGTSGPYLEELGLLRNAEEFPSSSELDFPVIVTAGSSKYFLESRRVF
jgi:hypothetical protein